MSIEVLKQALEALECGDHASLAERDSAIISLRQAIAEAEKQEPFGWYSAQEDEFMTHKIRKEHERLNSYTHKVGKFDLALYTSPPQRQPLTDEIPQGVLFAINKAGLTLLKTQHGYELRNIGPAIAHGIKGEA